MKKILFIAIFTLMNAWSAFAQFDQPFGASAELNEPGTELIVSFDVPFDHYLYKETVDVSALSGGTIELLEAAEAKTILDSFTGEQKEVFEHSFAMTFKVSDLVPPLVVEAKFQGCDHGTCYFPGTEKWSLGASAIATVADVDQATGETVAAWGKSAKGFKQVRSGSGFLKAEDFLSLLQDDKSIEGDLAGGEIVAEEGLEDKAPWIAVLLILLGGLALNFTPCVLPMIPINLAIIGAGAQSSSRGRGFALGATYGLGIAMAYGVLGLVVVKTGAAFGTINSTPWFNYSIAGIFIVLALGMFDLIHIDLSRFQKAGGASKKKSGFGLAFFMGVVAALLAGACVAPVVISVLVWSSKLYAQGVGAGLLLPFVLGLGMALPWPFAGGGLTFLPKPGMWMVWVRNGFGVLILVMAAYYGYLGFKAGAESDVDAENSKLEAAFIRAAKSGKPVLIDFSASWCKNCETMELTTFKDPAVISALEGFEFVQYMAEKPADPQVKAVLEFFSVRGLPTYVILSL